MTKKLRESFAAGQSAEYEVWRRNDISDTER